MPPSYRKPRGERRREMNTRLLFTLDSLPKDSSSPEENSFDSHLLPTKESRARTGGNTNPVSRTGLSIRLAYWPVATFVVAQCLGATQDANETGLPCPARARASCTRFLSLPSQRSSPETSGGFRHQIDRLSTCSPLPHYGVLITSLTATHRVPIRQP